MEEDDMRFYGVWGSLLLVLGLAFAIADIGTPLLAFSGFFIMYGAILALLALGNPKMPLMFGSGAGMSIFGFLVYFVMTGTITLGLMLAVIFAFIGLGILGFGMRFFKKG